MKKIINIQESELIELISSTVRTMQEQTLPTSIDTPEETPRGYEHETLNTTPGKYTGEYGIKVDGEEHSLKLKPGVRVGPASQPATIHSEPNWGDLRKVGPFFNRTHFLEYYKENIKDKFEEEIFGEKYYPNIMAKQFPAGKEVPYLAGKNSGGESHGWNWRHKMIWASQPVQSIVKFYNKGTCMKCIMDSLKGKSPEQTKLGPRQIEKGVSGWVGSTYHPKVHYSLRGKATDLPEYEFDYNYGGVASEIFLEVLKGGYTKGGYGAYGGTPEYKKLSEWLISFLGDGKELRTGDPKIPRDELAWTLQTITPMILWCHNECNKNE